MTPTACREVAPLLDDRLAGELDPRDAVRLEAHLLECAACRAGADAGAALLAGARLPAPSPAEARALDGLPSALRVELRRAARRRAIPTRVAASVAAVAAVAAFLAAPAFSRRAPAISGGDVAAAGRWGATAAPRGRAVPAAIEGGAVRSAAPRTGWEAPDPERLLDEAAAVEDGGAARDAAIAIADL